jgi:hypothetical protein
MESLTTGPELENSQGPLRQFAVTQQFSRFRSEADIQRAQLVLRLASLAPREPGFVALKAKPASRRAAATAAARPAAGA